MRDQGDHPFVVLIIGMGRGRVGEIAEPEQGNWLGDIDGYVGDFGAKPGVQIVVGEFR